MIGDGPVLWYSAVRAVGFDEWRKEVHSSAVAGCKVTTTKVVGDGLRSSAKKSIPRSELGYSRAKVDEKSLRCHKQSQTD